MSRIAFLGLGRMGAPMAANLVTAGNEVTVWNRTRATAEEFARTHHARHAETPADAATGADSVITMLADDEAVMDALTGDSGALNTLAAGSLAIDMSTVAPTTSRQLHEHCAARDVAFLDAPVSGSTAAAASGTLTVLVGGSSADFARAQPVFKCMAAKLLRLGEPGSGTAMKLAINAVVHGLNNALSEALVLAECAGIERQHAYHAFLASAVAAPFVQYRQAAFENPEGTPAAFRLDLAIKDLRLALLLADDVCTALPQTAANAAIMRAASQAGFGDHDESAVAVYLRNQTRTKS